MRTTPETQARLIRLATAFDADVPGEESITFTMPEDLTALGDEELAELRADAVEAFDALYESEDADLGSDDVTVMQQLADAVDAIRSEENRRESERQEARETAQQLAQRVRPEESTEEVAETEAAEIETAETAEPVAEEQAVEQAPAEERELVTASSNGPVTLTVQNVRRRRRSAPTEPEAPAQPFSLTAAADMPGHANGAEITFSDVGQAWLRRAQGVSPDAYRSAYRAGRRMTQQFGLASIHKHFDERLVVTGEDADEAIAYAVDESRLPGGSLVASGDAWCSPSETLYDLFSLETSEGLFSLPEIMVTRGGIRWTQGPDFSAIFDGTGYFNFTADEVGDGDYDGEGGGTKPCMQVPCPPFLEERLNAAGLCITSGILQNRSYPELLERFTRGALVAHENKMSERVLNAIVGESTAVNFPAGQAGALAPVLSAVELQIEDYRQRHRMARAASVEVIAPYWLRGAIRSDLSRRLGVNLTNVTDAVIGEHFANRGAAVQFVYNLDDLTGDADARLAWPTSVKVLIYAAGTWVRGSSDIITLDSVFDSALFKVNDFTALFTEEGWLVAQAGHDSRVVTIPICPDGSTHGGIDIDCDGTVVVPDENGD